MKKSHWYISLVTNANVPLDYLDINYDICIMTYHVRCNP